MNIKTEYTAQDLLEFIELEYKATEFPTETVTPGVLFNELSKYNCVKSPELLKELFELILAKYQHFIDYTKGVEYSFKMKKYRTIIQDSVLYDNDNPKKKTPVYKVSETIVAADAKELVEKMKVTASYVPAQLKADGSALRTEWKLRGNKDVTDALFDKKDDNEGCDKPEKPCTWAVSAGDPIPKCIYCGKRDICNKPN